MRRAQAFSNVLDKSVVAVGLCGIPHHYTPKALELLRVLNHFGQLGCRDIPRARRSSECRHPDNDLYIFVLRHSLGPVVPLVEIVFAA